MDAQQTKARIMAETAESLIKLIDNRLKSRTDAILALAGTATDQVPDEVKKMREVEAGKIRAVMQEQKDLIEIIKALFPSGG